VFSQPPACGFAGLWTTMTNQRRAAHSCPQSLDNLEKQVDTQPHRLYYGEISLKSPLWGLTGCLGACLVSVQNKKNNARKAFGARASGISNWSSKAGSVVGGHNELI